MSHESVSRQLENDFNNTAALAENIDRTENVPYRKLYEEKDMTATGGKYREFIGTGNGPWIGVERPNRNGHIQGADASVTKDETPGEYIFAESHIRRLPGKDDVDRSTMTVHRNGKSKELSSDNPLVADMIARIAVKGVREKADAKHESRHSKAA